MGVPHANLLQAPRYSTNQEPDLVKNKEHTMTKRKQNGCKHANMEFVVVFNHT